MKRTVRGAIVAAVGAGMAAIMAPACVEYPQSIIVTGVTVLQPSDDGSCRADGTEQDRYIEGVVDVAVAQSYVATLAVENRLRASIDDSKARSETNNVYLLGASVRLTLASGEPLDSDPQKDGRGGNEFRTVGSGFLTPKGPGTISVNLLDSAAICQVARRVQERVTAGNLRPQDQSFQLIAYARVQAQTAGGLSIESQEFQFPVKLCWGCLVDLRLQNGRCFAESEDTESTPPCRRGQDQIVKCKDCEATSEYCATGNITKVLPGSCRP